MLAHPTGITIIAQSLKTNNPKIKILGLFYFMPGCVVRVCVCGGGEVVTLCEV